MRRFYPFLFLALPIGSFAQYVGIGIANPQQKLAIAGWIELGDESDGSAGTAGTVRYNSSGKIQFYNGSGWIDILSGNNTGDFIQNQSTSCQTGAKFWIGGNGQMDTLTLSGNNLYGISAGDVLLNMNSRGGIRMKIDIDNDGSEDFAVQNGTGSNVFTVTESGAFSASSNGTIDGDLALTGASRTFSAGDALDISASSGVDIILDNNNDGSSSALDIKNNGSSNVLFSIPEDNRPTAYPFGTSTGNTGGIRFRELAANGSNYIALRVPDVIGSDYTFTLPGTDGGSNQVLKTDGTGLLSWTEAGALLTAGTGINISSNTISNTGVTSVGLSLPGIFSVSGSPVATTGTLTGTLANQSANTLFAGPSSGGAGAPSFRALVAADIPTGATGYIQNQNSAAQTTANFWISGVGRFGDGATATPSVTFNTGGLNAGMWSPGANVVAFSTSSLERMRIQSGGQVSIGATGAGAKLDVHQSTSTATVRFYNWGASNDIEMRRSGGSISIPAATGAGSIVGRLRGMGYDGTNFLNTGSIAFENETATTTTNSDGRIIFSTTPIGTITEVERMRITAAGNVGIATTSPSAKLNIVNAENATLTTFTQAVANAGILITPGYTASTYTPGLFWSTSNNNSTKPKAGIWLLEDGSGTDMYFGTSNSYSTGITNSGIVLDQTGNVGMGIVSPSKNLHIWDNGDAALWLEADADNVTESDNAYIKLTQDGAAVNSIIGLTGGADIDGEGSAYTDALSNSLLIGTNTNYPMQLGTNSVAQLTILNSGNIGIGNNAPVYKLDVEGATGNAGYFHAGTAGSTESYARLAKYNYEGVYGYAYNDDGVYGTTASASYYGVVGYNTGATGTGIYGNGVTYGIYGYTPSTASSTYGVRGTWSSSRYGYLGGKTVNGYYVGAYGNVNGSTEFGVLGNNDNSSGTAIAGAGNNVTTFYRLTAGSGLAGTGTDFGVYGYASTNANSTWGGYFSNAAGSYSYVGGHTSGGTARKIEGNGSSNSTITAPNGSRVLVTCPEAPDILLMDYGVGNLVNGRTHIDIDPILSKNIVVDDNHPLFVLITLEGDCKGVYVTGKSKNGFDVIELAGGTSNVPFTWNMTANRADDFNADGSLFSKNVDVRFQKADLPRENVGMSAKHDAEGEDIKWKQDPLENDRKAKQDNLPK